MFSVPSRRIQAAVRKAETRRREQDQTRTQICSRNLLRRGTVLGNLDISSTEQPGCPELALLLHRGQGGYRDTHRVQQALQAMALSHGVRRGPTLWNRDGQAVLASAAFAQHAAHRQQ